MTKGKIGGYKVKKMIQMAEEQMAENSVEEAAPAKSGIIVIRKEIC